LISVTTPSGTVAYKYDPFGRLALKTTSTSATRYLYSGMQRIEEYDNTTGNLLRRYVYGVSLDECLFTVDASGTVTYLHGDETGSTILTTDSTGMPTQRNVYAPYGQLSSGSLTNLNIGYTGQFFEVETGLYFYKARHYSPKLGRFLQPDPIGYEGGLNLYEYCGSDPINFSDPFGLFRFFDGIGGGLFGNTGRLIGGLIDGYITDRINKIIDDYVNKAVNALFGGGNSGPSFAQRVSDLLNAFASSMNTASQMIMPSVYAAPPAEPPNPNWAAKSPDVFVALKEVEVSGRIFYHTSIYIPDPNADGDYRDGYTIAAGSKNGRLVRYSGKKLLRDELGQIKSAKFIRVNPPGGPGQARDFITRINAAANSYQNNLRYGPFTDCNSFTSGVITAAGGTPPNLHVGLRSLGYRHPIRLPGVR
ncbi:MAG: RHS repeat-associated core domain-containing protein, partial [Candidatus Obscuribacterales bacterium]|nr:RHS repeat-associated core domain-containing protein [Candidatus Obscuribacterales bacterium]